MRFLGKVYVMPRKDLLDPQGGAVRNALHHLGFKAVVDVRVGKEIDVVLEAEDGDSALAMLKDMCEKLLANPITEDYDYLVMREQELEANSEASSNQENS